MENINKIFKKLIKHKKLKLIKKKITPNASSKTTPAISPAPLDQHFIELLKKYKLRSSELSPHLKKLNEKSEIEQRRTLLVLFFMGLFDNDMDIATSHAIDFSEGEFKALNSLVKANESQKAIKLKISTITYSLNILNHCSRWGQDFAQDTHAWKGAWEYARFILIDNRVPLPIITAKIMITLISNQVSAGYLPALKFLELLELYDHKFSEGFSEEIDFLIFLHQLPQRPFKATDMEKFTNFRLTKKEKFLARIDELQRTDPTNGFRIMLENESEKTRVKLKKVLEIIGLSNSVANLEQIEHGSKTIFASKISHPDDTTSTYKRLITQEKYEAAHRMLRNEQNALWPLLNEHFELCASMNDYALLHELIDINFEKLSSHNDIDTKYFNQLLKLVQKKHEAHFLSRISSYYDRASEVGKNPKGYVICNMRDLRALRAMPIPVLIELQNQGWEVIQLNDKILKNSSRIQSALQHPFGKAMRAKNHELLLDWEIDFDKKEAITLGLNLWHGIMEHVRIGTRQYTPDLSQDKISTEFMYRLRNSDKAIYKLLSIIKYLGAKKPIRIFIDNPHITPAASLRQYVEQHFADYDIAIVQYVNSYESFSSQNLKPYSQAITVGNLTKHQLSHARMGNKEEFDFWRKQHKFERASKKKSPVLIPTKKQSSFLLDLERYKKANKKIYCLIGKTVFDFTDTSAKGCVHQSFEHFINDTIDTVAKLNDTILLIKPHPHEKSSEIALFSQTGLSDLVKNSAKNIRILEPNQIPLSMLLPYISLGILWSGSSVVELSEAGVSHVSCSKTSENEIPLKTYVPKSLEDYHNFLKSPRRLIKKQDMQKLACDYRSYLQSKFVMIPYRYTNRPVTNRNLWPNLVFEKDFERYFSGKDTNIQNIVKKVIS